MPHPKSRGGLYRSNANMLPVARLARLYRHGRGLPRPMSGAIWLASYPHSGGNRMRLALRALCDSNEDVASGGRSGFGCGVAWRDLIDRELEVDSGLLTEPELQELRPQLHAAMFGRSKVPRPAKVHDAWVRTPDGHPIYDRSFTHAAIYLIRDPRDIAVQWARHHGWPFDRAIAHLADAGARLGRIGGMHIPQQLRSWSGHVSSWLDESGLDPLPVRYEDMATDPRAALERMAARLGWNTSPQMVAGAIVAHADSALPDGKMGMWREDLTRGQAARIERDHGEAMARFGYL